VGPSLLEDGEVELAESLGVDEHVDLAARRAVRWRAGWTIGGLAPEMVGKPATMMREAWTAAGLEGSLPIVALPYFSLGDGAAELSQVRRVRNREHRRPLRGGHATRLHGWRAVEVPLIAAWAGR
jgi:hypothetical protein